MNSQFSQLMAEMIAKARPQQAPPQSHPTVMNIRGGASPAYNRQFEANFDLGAMAKLLGMPEHELLRKQIDQVAELLPMMDPDSRNKFLDNPGFQEYLKKNAKYDPRIYVDPDTQKMRIATADPKYAQARQLAPLGEHGFLAGYHGEQARQQLIEGHQRIKYPYDMIQRDPLARKEFDIGLEKSIADIGRIRAEELLKRSQADLVSKQAEALIQPEQPKPVDVAKEKETVVKTINQIMEDHGKAMQEYHKNVTMFGRTPELRFNMITSHLAPATERGIAIAKSSGMSDVGNAVAMPFLRAIQNELHDPRKPGWWGLGSKPKLTDEQRRMYNEYLHMSLDVASRLGTSAGRDVMQQVLNNSVNALKILVPNSVDPRAIPRVNALLQLGAMGFDISELAMFLQHYNLLNEDGKRILMQLIGKKEKR